MTIAVLAVATQALQGLRSDRYLRAIHTISQRLKTSGVTMAR